MKTFKIPHIAKMEGHADFLALMSRGEVTKAKLCVREGARLIEGIVLGRKIWEIPIIISRICGICPTVHNLCAISAIEKALELEVSEETKLLRRLMLCGQMIHSHGLHLFFLSLPDFFDLTSDLKLIKKYPKETKQAIALRGFGTKIVEAVGGRTIHPMNSEIGGFKTPPDKRKLAELMANYETALEAAISLAKLFKSLKYPQFGRKTNFVSLFDSGKYPLSSDEIFFNGEETREKFGVGEFYKKIKEIQTPGEVIKRTEFMKQECYLVGALARLNNNSGLNQEAAKLRKGFSDSPDFNIFHNIFAQAIEAVHFTEEAGKIIKEALAGDFDGTGKKYKMKSGQGLCALEAPRGVLFHYYEIDKSGSVANCNIITPTAQFLNNLEEDLKFCAPEIFKKLCRDDCQKRIRTLIRAYDPCVSCAAH